MWGGWWRWALVSLDGVAPSRMVSVSASVNLPLQHKVQKFSSGTGSPGWSQKRAVKRLSWWWWWFWAQIWLYQRRTVTVYTEHCPAHCFMPGIISLIITCTGIIWNNSVSRRTRPGRGSNRTSATANVTLYCTWRPSVLHTGPHGQVKELSVSRTPLTEVAREWPKNPTSSTASCKGPTLLLPIGLPNADGLSEFFYQWPGSESVVNGCQIIVIIVHTSQLSRIVLNSSVVIYGSLVGCSSQPCGWISVSVQVRFTRQCRCDIPTPVWERWSVVSCDDDSIS